MNAYEQARERFGRANQNCVKAAGEAARLVREAEEEWVAAADSLCQYETTPGIPLPEYREQVHQ